MKFTSGLKNNNNILPSSFYITAAHLLGMEPKYCLRCKAEGRETILFYSEPLDKELDTWSKRLEKKSDFRCISHVRNDAKLYRSEQGRAKHRKRSENIEQYHQRRIMKFQTMWNDKTIVDDKGRLVINLPHHERLMWIFIRYGIRKASLGFTPAEMTEVIREADIEFDIMRKISEWREDAKDRGLTLLVREQVEPELIKIYVSMREEMQESHRKRLVNSTRGLAHAANITWLQKPEDKWEKLVTDPSYKDPEGNKAERIHLLTEAETLRRRQERKMQHIEHIKEIMEQEAKVQVIVQQHLKPDAGVYGATENQ